jgi:hypothetical protein
MYTNNYGSASKHGAIPFQASILKVWQSINVIPSLGLNRNPLNWVY